MIKHIKNFSYSKTNQTKITLSQKITKTKKIILPIKYYPTGKVYPKKKTIYRIWLDEKNFHEKNPKNFIWQ